MGTKFLRKERAAAILGVSARTVFRYLQRGLLQPAHDGKNIGVWEDDVLKLKKARDLDVPTVLDRELVMKLMADIETMKSQMATVMRILNVKYESLNLTDPEFRTLYKMAEIYSLEGWPPHAEEQWADTFVRLKFDDLERLEFAVDDPHPWRTFLRLATSMHLNSYNKELRDILAAGRTNIQHIAGIWCTTKGETPKTFDLLVQRDAAPIKKLMRQLAKTRS